MSSSPIMTIWPYQLLMSKGPRNKKKVNKWKCRIGTFTLNSDNVGYYVFLSNVYANVGKWEGCPTRCWGGWERADFDKS